MSPFVFVFIFGVAVGSYLQTMTGFALGIVVTGVMALSGITSINNTADALSIITIFNALVVLPKLWRYIDWSSLTRLICSLLIGVVLGVLLLDFLTGFYSSLLRVLAGFFVLLGGVSLVFDPQKSQKEPGSFSTFLFGLASGVMSGLFSLPGPPIVYYYYKKNIFLKTVRANLITIFSILAAFRLLFVYFNTGVSYQSLQASAYGIPVVIFFSWVGIRFPLSLSDRSIKKIVCFMLIFVGLMTIILTFLD